MSKKSGDLRIIRALAVKLLKAEIFISQGCLVIEGNIVNKNEEELDCLLAMAHYYTAEKVFVKKADMIINEGYLKSKSISFFSIITEDDPKIEYAELSFKLLLGPDVEVEGDTRLHVIRKQKPAPFIDFEIRKNIAPGNKKN